MRQAWFRVFGCGICHRTGVIIAPECDCGTGPWSPHEEHCATVPCPRYCRVTDTRDEALDAWRRYWPPRLLAGPPEVITENDDDLGARPHL